MARGDVPQLCMLIITNNITQRYIQMPEIKRILPASGTFTPDCEAWLAVLRYTKEPGHETLGHLIRLPAMHNYAVAENGR